MSTPSTNSSPGTARNLAWRSIASRSCVTVCTWNPAVWPRHTRTVPMPAWVKVALDEWAAQAGITQGRIFRAVGRAGKVWGKGVSQNVVWYVVQTCCERAGVQHIAPHDLRRTCAKLCHSSGGELEQIQCSCWAMPQCRRRNVISAANRTCGIRSTICLTLEPSPRRKNRVLNPPLRDRQKQCPRKS